MIENRFPRDNCSRSCVHRRKKLAGEIERSFDFCREESSGMKVNKLILSGGGSQAEGAGGFLSAGAGD